MKVKTLIYKLLHWADRLMKWLMKLLRVLVVPLLCLLVTVPLALVVAVSVDGVQQRIAHRLAVELSSTLGAEVTIGDLGIVPVNRVVLRRVAVVLRPDSAAAVPAVPDTVLTVDRLGASVSLISLWLHEEVVVNSVELFGVDLRLRRDSLDAPLNIAPILVALQPKDKNKPPTSFDLKINSLMLRSSAMSYDVASEPRPEPGRFSPHHVAVADLRADIHIPRLSNHVNTVNIRRMAARERSGLTLSNLSAIALVSDTLLRLDKFTAIMPESRLALADVSLPINGFGTIAEALKTEGMTLSTLPGSHIAAADLAPLLPEPVNGLLQGSTMAIDRLALTGNERTAAADLALSLSDGSSLSLRATAANPLTPAAMTAEVSHLLLTLPAASLSRLAANRGTSLPTALGDLTLEGSADLSTANAAASLSLISESGTLHITANASRAPSGALSASADIVTDGRFNLGALARTPVDAADLAISLSGENLESRSRTAHADIDVNLLEINGYPLAPFKAEANYAGAHNLISLNTAVNDPALRASVGGVFSPGPSMRVIDAIARIDNISPWCLRLLHDEEKADFSATLDIDLIGEHYHAMHGTVDIANAAMRLADGRHLEINSAVLDLQPEAITLTSDFVDASLRGTYDFRTLPAVVASLAAHSLPALGIAERPFPADATPNDFTLQASLNPTEPVAEFFRLPASVIYPATLSAAIEEPSRSASLLLNAPYLRQGNKLIENTRLSLDIDGPSALANLNLATTVPSKEGPMQLLLIGEGADNSIDTDLTWRVDRAARFDGHIAASTHLQRTPAGHLLSTVNLERSQLTFNDSTWTVDPATITLLGTETIKIDRLHAHHADRYINIDGTASASAADRLTLNLQNFSLDYLFDILNIESVMLGGVASGTFYASQLLSPEPMIETPGLAVHNISYNRVVIGDATVRSHWDTDRRAITLDADIAQSGGHLSHVDGAIMPLNDSLDITFIVDHANIGFLHRFMATFASEVEGYATGRVRLFGNFKNVDLEGHARADRLSLGVDFTKVTYHAEGDSVIFRPGRVEIPGMTIRDPEGHTARLSGALRHRFFKDLEFDFAVTDARQLLSYNETMKDNPRWYGTIYGNGSAFLSGVPGRIDVNVDMATAPRSTFTFVLSDMEVANEFSFITFRDKNRLQAQITDSLTLRRTDDLALVERLRAMAAKKVESDPSDFNISLQLRVTPQARIDLIMDPVGGDRIRAFGSGHLRLDYNAFNDDLKMYGTYTLDRGNYNFTLQDIIIKDFTIDPGSSIVFQGDPLAAQLDIEAAYSLNANLSDLDESFLQDKELNRTNVPVQAVMKVRGDMRQPDIAFDLRFPTLTTDVYRKVKSIISTDDMMNRQIMYLLALNRFYTPEYMQATKGNELVSVASSTISSQLRNMLGQISDNWSIAPTFRSDRGDFSDVEVDVALSSSLLNNRLLFNGNFGYRDKALNSNQFIGDFDLEYLLDRTGKWRLKAYNRYNDQNYYLRTALTTQGVGVVLKQDFDSFLSFLRRRPASAPLPSPAGAPSATPTADTPKH